MRKKQNSNEKISLFLRGSVALVISNVLLKAMNFFLLPLYTENLTPEMLGISDSVSTIIGFLTPLLIMGLDSAYSAFYFDKNDDERAKKVYSTLSYTFAIIGLIPILLIAFSKQISELLLKNRDYYFAIIIALITISLNIWYMPKSLELRLKNKMTLFSINTIASSTLLLVLNVVFVTILKIGVYSLLLSSLIVAAFQLVLLSFLTGYLPEFYYFDVTLLKEMLRFSLPIVPTCVMIWVLTLSDRYVLLHYCGENSVGQYGIGSRFANLLNVVVSAVNMAYTTFAFSTKDDKESNWYYSAIFDIMSVTLVLISFLISIFAPEIVKLMTAESYSESYKSVRDLVFAQSVYALTTIIGYGIYFEKRSELSLVSVSVAAATNLFLNIILIPQYGVTAAAAATLISFLIYFGFITYFSKKVYPCKYNLNKLFWIFSTNYFCSIFFLNSRPIFKLFLVIIIITEDYLIYAKELRKLFVEIKGNI